MYLLQNLGQELSSKGLAGNILILLLIAVFGTPQITQAQKQYQLEVEYLAADDHFRVLESLDEKSPGSDSLSIFSVLRQYISALHFDAYLEAQIKSVRYQDSTMLVGLHIGPQYTWTRLRYRHLSPSFLQGTKVSFERIQDSPMHYREVAGMMDQILENAENLGFPFAQVMLDSLQLTDAEISAAIALDKGNRILIDTIDVVGDLKLGAGFITNYLGIAQGDIYQRKKILQIPSKLRDLAFVSSKHTPQVVFRKDNTTLRVFADKKNASQFDLILGILPQGQTGQPPIITGSFIADVVNTLGGGERLFLNIERFKPRTQKLELAITYPFLLGIPFGIDASFDLHKEDTLYTDLNADFGLQYYFDGLNYIKGFWDNKSTSLITIRSSQMIQNKRLPESLDLRINSVGVEVAFQKLDYRFNPRKGYSILLSGSSGTKNIRKNEEILALADIEGGFDPDSQYNALELRSSRHQVDAHLMYFLPLGKRSTIKLENKTGIISGNAQLYLNEIYRIGGNKLLRGFDEESILADAYSVFTLEYRFLFSQNSYFALFGDYGIVQNRVRVPVVRDRPFGFGAGLSFETKAGIFGLSTAVGKQQDNPLDLRAAKIHFGYVNLF